LSIDPDVASTNQPYAFTNDDPLNAVDPLGLETVGEGISPSEEEVPVVDWSGDSNEGGNAGDGEVESTKGDEKSDDKLNEEQQKNLKRFDRSLPKGAEEVKITKLPNGNIRFQAKVPASNVPGSYTEYFKIVEEDGDTAPDGWFHDTYDQNGDFVHRHF
jgi:hypothetical protein